MHAINIDPGHLNGFISALKKQRHGRMHHRRKTGHGTATFVTANVSREAGVLLHGRVTGPTENHADYSVSISSSSGTIQIFVSLEDPNGTYSLEKAYADIVYGIRVMMRNPNKTTMGGRDTSRLKGFYLKSTGKNSVGEKGKITLALAVKEGHISKKFREHCISAGFTMERF